MNLLKDFTINGIAHITGGGLLENIPRVLPKGCKASIHLNRWDRPPIFSLLQQAGNVEQHEMYRTFNMGIGMVLAVAEEETEEILTRLNGLGEHAWIIGDVAVCPEGCECVELLEG
jgi:phosphoribosylformylglycinamidine cyclo-ligase